MRHEMVRRMSFKTLLMAFFLVLLCALPALAVTGPTVWVMPNGDTDTTAYTWAGNSLSIWGRAKWGDSATGTYAWDINNDGTPEYTGAVSNINDIKCTHTYAAAGLYEAKLTVTDGNGLSSSAVVRIKVLPAMTKEARIQLAIEKGLKWLYLRGKALGNGSIYYVNSNSSSGAETGAAVLAFENRGHKPCTKDLNGDGLVNSADRAIWEQYDIYAETVHKGLDYMISTLVPEAISAEPAGNPDTNGNGIGIRDSYYYDAPYKIGMYMMALVGAGDIASGAPNLVATTGPANITGRTYKAILQDMVDWCAWAQNDPSTGSYRGGWRYYADYGSSDNSACQWPCIGMEAAEFAWGCTIPAFVKTENALWTTYSQYTDGRFGYTCNTCQGTGGYAALTGSGICELSFQGKEKDDPLIIKAGNYLKSDKGTGNMYYMYAVCKGARIAKKSGVYSEIQTLGSAPGWDWYDEYSTWLISNQSSDGSWYTWGYTQYALDTAWGVEILTKNVFTLRPIAKLAATPNPTPANTAITFDLSGCFHQDSTKTLVGWSIDVDNDGTYDLNGTFPVTTPIIYGGYTDKGADYTATAKLRISDNSSPVEYAEDLLSIKVTSGNVPPVAVPGGPYNGVIGSPITFDGSASYDPNAGQSIPGNHIVKWEWDLDGDGIFETLGQVVMKTWNAPYSGNIGLKVTDDAGLSNTAQAYTQVFVVDLWPENYVLVSRKIINLYTYEYEYKFDMRNRGNAIAKNVKCTVDSAPSQITVTDNNVSFGDIPAGMVKTSLDTFKFRMDRRYPAADYQFRWKLEYDDMSGNHVTFLDFPLR